MRVYSLTIAALSALLGLGCPATDPIPLYERGYPNPSKDVVQQATEGEPGPGPNVPSWLVPDDDDATSAATPPGESGAPPVNTPPISPASEDPEESEEPIGTAADDEEDPTNADGGDEPTDEQPDDGEPDDPAPGTGGPIDPPDDPTDSGSDEAGGDDGGVDGPDPVETGEEETDGDPTGDDGTDGGEVDPLETGDEETDPEELDGDAPPPFLDTPPKICEGEERTQDAAVIVQKEAAQCAYPDPWLDSGATAIDWITFDGARACGACIEVTGPLGSAVARIVDRCKVCNDEQIRVSDDVWSKIAAGPGYNWTKVTWRYVSCPTAGSVSYHFKDGSSAYWTAVQVRNARNAVVKLEWSDDGLTFHDTDLQDWNYFVAGTGMGYGPYAFRMTDTFGSVVLEKLVLFEDPDTLVQGTVQFPYCP